jgi:hypothetical protein
MISDDATPATRLQPIVGQPIGSMRQAELLGIIEDVCYEMAFGKNSDGFRYDANDEIANIVAHAGYAIEELARRRCTDGQGGVSHDFSGSRCRKCGKSG